LLQLQVLVVPSRHWQALPPIPLLQLVLPTLSLRHSRMQPT